MDRPCSSKTCVVARSISLFLLLLGSAKAVAAPVHAVVHLRKESPPAAPSGYVYTVNAVLPIAMPLRDARQDALLVLEPSGSTPAPPLSTAPVEIRIFGSRFLPEIGAASPGTQVVFRNEDR